MKALALFAASALVAAAVACSASVSNLPTHDLLNGNHAAPAGATTGTLIDESGCVLIENAAGTMLVIWPRGFARVGQQIADDGYPVAQIGEFVTVFGGSTDAQHYDRTRSTFGGSAVSAECATQTLWTATAVAPPDPS